MDTNKTNKSSEKCNTKHIKGISCNVRSCAYHEGDCYCTAECITVGPCSADCSSDTVCDTFKPKS